MAAIDPAYEEPIEGEAEAGDDVHADFRKVAQQLLAAIRSPNLADERDADELARIGAKVCEEYDLDVESRKAEGWQERQEAGLKLAMLTKEAKSYPWPNASNVKFPLITSAAIQFAARAYPAIVDGANVAKGKVMGRPSPEKQARADRIGRHMSYQLLDQMEEWEEDTDRMLHILPCAGSVFRKTYFDPKKGRNVSELVTADRLVVNYWAAPLEVCPRVTQVCDYYPHEVVAKFRGGLWRQIDLGEPANSQGDDDAPHVFLEQHRLLDLDDDGYPEPYIVTVHRETQRVVRIVARYDEKGVKFTDRGEVYCIEPVRYFTHYQFIPSLDGSFYGVGFGTLLVPLNETINSTINQLMDAGHLSNVQGGFIGAGVSLKSGALKFSPGEWKRVETPGGILAQNIVPLPAKEPSSVLFNLLGMLITAAQDVTATKDILTGETGQSNMPVGTTLAMIEQGLKVFTAIYKRIHRSLKQELACLYRLNSLYLQPEEYFVFQDEEGAVSQQDYAEGDVDVIPVSDPTVVTDMQRIGRAQFLMQFMGAPGMNPQEIERRVLTSAGIADIDGLFMPANQGPSPEQMLALAEMELRKKELEQKDRELDLKEGVTRADVATKQATAQKTTVETALLAPELLPVVQQMIQQAVAMTLAASEERHAAVQPGQLPAMAGLAGNEGVPPVPQGQPVDLGPEMGGGGAAIPGPADQGADLGGDVFPGMG